jgi:hypothetical protein
VTTARLLYSHHASKKIGPLYFSHDRYAFRYAPFPGDVVETFVQLLIIIAVLEVSKMAQVLNYPGILPRRPRSVSLFSTNIHCDPGRVLTSFGASTLRIVGSVEPIIISSCSRNIKLLAVPLDRIAHKLQSESRCCGIPWGNGATGAHITLNRSISQSIASCTGGLPGSIVMIMPSRSLPKIRNEHSLVTGQRAHCSFRSK